MEDHLPHLFPRLAEAQKLLAQQHPVVLTNPFPHGKNMIQASSSADGGSQGPLVSSSNPLAVNVYIMKGDAYIETSAHDYEITESTKKGKEAKNPPVPLHIERIMGETMKHISKGEFKKASHNSNIRAAHNYSVVEDLSKTPCTRLALEVLHSFPS
jgi:hypothetical protein